LPELLSICGNSFAADDERTAEPDKSDATRARIAPERRGNSAIIVSNPRQHLVIKIAAIALASQQVGQRYFHMNA
jgi:hypothetical protein